MEILNLEDIYKNIAIQASDDYNISYTRNKWESVVNTFNSGYVDFKEYEQVLHEIRDIFRGRDFSFLKDYRGTTYKLMGRNYNLKDIIVYVRGGEAFLKITIYLASSLGKQRQFSIKIGEDYNLKKSIKIFREKLEEEIDLKKLLTKKQIKLEITDILNLIFKDLELLSKNSILEEIKNIDSFRCGNNVRRGEYSGNGFVNTGGRNFHSIYYTFPLSVYKQRSFNFYHLHSYFEILKDLKFKDYIDTERNIDYRGAIEKNSLLKYIPKNIIEQLKSPLFINN